MFRKVKVASETRQCVNMVQPGSQPGIHIMASTKLTMPSTTKTDPRKIGENDSLRQMQYLLCTEYAKRSPGPRQALDMSHYAGYLQKLFRDEPSLGMKMNGLLRERSPTSLIDENFNDLLQYKRSREGHKLGSNGFIDCGLLLTAKYDKSGEAVKELLGVQCLGIDVNAKTAVWPVSKGHGMHGGLRLACTHGISRCMNESDIIVVVSHVAGCRLCLLSVW